MKALGIVPARAGSKRVPRKNLRPLGGQPLVAHVIDAALSARSLNAVALSSDDPDILAVGRSKPGAIVVERPAEFATDTSPAIDYVRHTLQELAHRGMAFDAVVIVQPSSPLTTAADIDSTVEMLAHSGADSVVSVMKLDHAIHPIKLKRMVGDRLVPYLEEEAGRMASHELPELFVRNCAVYATRRTVIEGGAIIGGDCRGYVMPRERSIDINDEIDLAFCEFLFARIGGRV